MPKTLPQMKVRFEQALADMAKEGVVFTTSFKRYEPYEAVADTIYEVVDRLHKVIGTIEYRRMEDMTWKLVVSVYNTEQDKIRSERERVNYDHISF